VRKEAYGSEKPDVASTILTTPRLALPTQLVEIKFVAVVKENEVMAPGVGTRR